MHSILECTILNSGSTETWVHGSGPDGLKGLRWKDTPDEPGFDYRGKPHSLNVIAQYPARRDLPYETRRSSVDRVIRSGYPRLVRGFWRLGHCSRSPEWDDQP